MELRPHQKEAIQKLKSGKVLWGGVGSGKTLTALAYYAQKDTLGDLYVITTARKRDSLDWEKEAATLGISTKKEFSLHGKLTVDSWNNIGKYTDVEGSTFLFDEQRLVGSGAWVKSFYKIAKKNAWILLSATPGDTWLDYIPVFVANKFYKNASEFKLNHVIYAPWSKFPQVRGYVNEGKLLRYKNEVLVEMPYERHTTRILKYLEVEHDAETVKRIVKDRWNVFEDRPIENVSELLHAMRRVVNSDESRLAEVRRLMEIHPRLIIFYNFNYELEILRQLEDTWSDLCPVAEWNGHKKQPIPDSDRWVYLVQYTSGAEAWNCIETDAMIFYSMNYSYRLFEQGQGRIDRMNTRYNVLNYYVFRSKAAIDVAISGKLRDKKSFNEKDWESSNW